MRAIVVGVIVAAAMTSVAAQGPLTGRWRLEAAASDVGLMGTRGASVPSAAGAESAPRTALPASVEELAIAEDPAAVALERRAAGQVERRELPLSGLVVTTSSPSGEAVQSRASKDGEGLVVTTEQAVTLPGGEKVTVTTEQRHTVLPDGRLEVNTTRTSGGRTRASRAVLREGAMSMRLTLTLALLLTAPAARAQTPAAPPGAIEYYHVDALGSVRAVTDASGAVVRTHHYHPFGEGVGVEAGTDPMRFTGKPRDGETGLDYFGARYYAQRTGRFTTVDPELDLARVIIDPQRFNRYAQSLNSPNTYVDPDGRNPQKIAQLLNGAARLLVGSRRVQAVERALERWSHRLGDKVYAMAARLTSSSGQPVLLGETADRVAAAQRMLRGVQTFDPKEAVTPANFARLMTQNLQWLQQRIAEGGRIFSIGQDPTRLDRGSFFQAEGDLLKSLGYAERVVAVIQVNGEAVRLTEWVKVF